MLLPLLFLSFAGMALGAEPTEPELIDIAFHYDPSSIAAVVFGIVYLIIGFVHVGYCTAKKSWWAWCLPIGALGSGLGLILRMVFIHSHPNSKPILSLSQILVICMPALFLAFNYMLYGRLVQWCVGKRHSVIRPGWITKVFVGCDISTFIIQGASAPLVLQEDKDKNDLGRTLFKIGVVLQTVTYYIFLLLVIWSHVSVKREKVANGREGWWKGFWTLYASSLFIVVRTIYRMAEALSEPTAAIRKSEGYFYGLDVVPLILCTIPYFFPWPTTYLGKESIVTVEEYQMVNPKLKEDTKPVSV